ncbi:MAG: hypothetical protein KA198_07235 [Chitinophagaceae bacterium]|nr:hypothetical protein [Chitinophagaceae bacterium]
MKYFAVILWLALCVIGISCRAQIRADYVNTISSSAIYEEIEGLPLDRMYTDVGSVKVVYDIAQKQLYFIHGKHYRLHYEFCKSVLSYDKGLDIFNEETYPNHPRREFFIGTINHFKSNGVYALELFSGTEMTKDQLIFFLNKIKATTFIKDSLKLFLNNPELVKLNQALQWPAITPYEVYKNQQVQILNTGTCKGKLTFVEKLQHIGVEDYTNSIIITQGSPLYIPYCKAVISNEFQTPLSHIQVLTSHRDMPAAIDVEAWQKESWRKFEGKLVEIKIDDEDIRIRPLSEKEIKAYREVSPQLGIQYLKYDTTIKEVISMSKRKLITSARVGSKASHFADLVLLSKRMQASFSVPENACAIPCTFYARHISDSLIQHEIALLKAISQDSLIKKQLKRIRRLIKAKNVDPALLTSLHTFLKGQEQHFISFRFRSSCNAEDLPDFSGAGLYSSVTGSLSDTTQSFEKAIKEVWASVYSYGAYQERMHFRIAEETVMMSILVHRNFPNERVNGVAISKNIYREGYSGTVVNIQQGNIKVVNPPKGVTCEQLLLYDNQLMNPASDKINIRYISYSSLHPESSLITKVQAKKLNDAMYQIRGFYYTRYANIDIEFKFDEENTLYIKQVRAYH